MSNLLTKKSVHWQKYHKGVNNEDIVTHALFHIYTYIYIYVFISTTSEEHIHNWNTKTVNESLTNTI